MNLTRKGHGHAHRGIIGVESAIVLIAFVIVAAALAFVVLNMGFSTTQKAKTTIISSLGEASSSLEVAGKITGLGDIPAASMEVVAVPIKIASGGDSVNLNNDTAAVKYLSNSVAYDDIYLGTLDEDSDGSNDDGSGQWNSTQNAVADAVALLDGLDSDPYVGANPTNTRAFIYWTVNANENFILDQGEHAVLAIVYNAADEPAALDKIRAEIIIPTGAALTVERQVPNITNTVVDLG